VATPTATAAGWPAREGMCIMPDSRIVLAQQQLVRLRGQFEAASGRWPNVKSLLVTWPEDVPQPPHKEICSLIGPAPGSRFVGIDDHGIYCYECDLLDGGWQQDTPAGRYRDGLAGLLAFQWPPEFGDGDDAKACSNRLKYLAEECAACLDVLGTWFGLSPATLRWKGYTRWQLAVFEVINPRSRQGECLSYAEMSDFFLKSAEAIDVWLASHDPVNMPDTGPWPLLAGWDFFPGKAAFHGREFYISGRPLEILKRFVNAKRTLEMVDLRELWPVDDVDDGTIRKALTDTRNAIRKGLGRPKGFDPFPRVSRGGDRTAWELSPDLR
jgi:hypothetical protein